MVRGFLKQSRALLLLLQAVPTLSGLGDGKPNRDLVELAQVKSQKTHQQTRVTQVDRSPCLRGCARAEALPLLSRCPLAWWPPSVLTVVSCRSESVP